VAGRQARSDVDGAGERRVGGGLGDIHDVRPVTHDEMAGQIELVADPFQQRRAQLGELEGRQVLEAQPQHRHAERIIAAIFGALYEAQPFERCQQPEYGGAGHSQPPRQLRRRRPTLAAPDLAEHAQASFQSWNDIFVWRGVHGGGRIHERRGGQERWMGFVSNMN